MSITFYAEDSPEYPPTMHDCGCTYINEGPDPTCMNCKGTGKIEFDNLEYEANFSNSNALPFTTLFTPDGESDYCGTIEVVDLPQAIEKLEKAEDDRRKEALLRIFNWAKMHNKKVFWS